MLHVSGRQLTCDSLMYMYESAQIVQQPTKGNEEHGIVNNA